MAMGHAGKWDMKWDLSGTWDLTARDGEDDVVVGASMSGRKDLSSAVSRSPTGSGSSSSSQKMHCCQRAALAPVAFWY